ncbi:15455_t:CDS:2 [Cetraspora pellucida]|uniref:15455_t:CDS:1 n=1 Tax=Cetraspora pellucida TaxID=1433469 RepID=A0ACA9M181_9GLOM|nr:15455_t:CDS:2 [Cetraspora pellucida]
MFPIFNIHNVLLLVLFIISASIYDNFRHVNLEVIQSFLLENIQYIFIFVCQFILWYKTGKTEKAISALSDEIYKLHKTFQTETEKKEKAISALSDNIYRTLETEIKKIETDILTLGETFKTDAKKAENDISIFKNDVSKMSETSQNETKKIEKEIKNDIKQIRETFQIKVKTIEKYISILNVNVNQICETFQTGTKKVEKDILALKNDISKIRESGQKHSYQGSNLSLTTNRISTIQNSDYSDIETLRTDFKALVVQRSKRETRGYFTSMLRALTVETNLTFSCMYTFYKGTTKKPRTTTLGKLREWVNNEKQNNNNLSSFYLH